MNEMPRTEDHEQEEAAPNSRKRPVRFWMDRCLEGTTGFTDRHAWDWPGREHGEQAAMPRGCCCFGAPQPSDEQTTEEV